MTAPGRAPTVSPRSIVSIPVAVAFAVIVFVVLFWRLGAPTFWDPDEAHYAETTRELIETGDWLAPYYNEQPFFDKPMLFHWLQGSLMALAGPNELAARLAAALAALALIGVTAWLGVSLLSAEVALVAALLLATNPAVFALARYAILDTVFTFFLFGGAALVRCRHSSAALQWDYVAIAMAVLVKGPLALVLCADVRAARAVEARPRASARLRFVVGVVIVLALAALVPPHGVPIPRRLRRWVSADENIRLLPDRFPPTALPRVWFYFRVLAAGLLCGRDYRALGRRCACGVETRQIVDPVDVLL